ncbi:MAG TPA: hypothetical protein VJZ76_13145 [Thermoanaerobaculia bacterium]|nr:hypothetical protein [Thermoanaerobaculia bacterium]
MTVLLIAGSAFAGVTANDDTCDIASNAPAATLLLPYFEVDFKSPPATARTTLFTIVNTSALPQIAHVVVWTDWSFPAVGFNLFLTGYGVAGINLYDVFARGFIAPGSGSQPMPTDANPNITSVDHCGNPGSLSAALLTDLQSIFTTGRGTGAAVPCTAQVGGVHSNAVGYVTIDVAPACHNSLPNEPGYFSLILFDNVLIGDYQDVNPNQVIGNFAGGNPLVPIRAIPEGGPSGSIAGTNLPYTFYDRYTAGIMPRTIDRRQPLPATWAARFISGGTGAFNTNFKIWREGFTIGACAGAGIRASSNSNLAIAAVARFDEHENATILSYPGGVCCIPGPPGTPGAFSISAANPTIFPPFSTSGDVGGWMYFNLNNNNTAGTYSVARAGFFPPGVTRPSQNWVIVSMFAEGRYSADFNAAWLGNGCSRAAPYSGTNENP